MFFLLLLLVKNKYSRVLIFEPLHSMNNFLSIPQEIYHVLFLMFGKQIKYCHNFYNFFY